ncbi:MAG: hypothetical protein HQK60_09635 [Deltaproteobacteria bacterium]|nr:hypothetical protein [Deltaproteobacteria bacterium]
MSGGFAFGPLLTGWLIREAGYPQAFGVMIAIGFVALVIFVVLVNEPSLLERRKILSDEPGPEASPKG